MDTELKIKYLVEWLKNGGEPMPHIIEDFKKIKLDKSNKIIEESITPPLNAMMLAIIACELHNPFFRENKLSEYNSQIQKEIFFDQKIIDNKSELNDYLNENIATPTLYRGVKESKWRLYNSLQREWILNGHKNNIEEYKKSIKKILNNARNIDKSVIKNFLEINNLNPNNDVAILSFLQHYGCPSPLLDWTYSKDIALYFAIENLQFNPNPKREIDNYCSIYFIEEKYFKGTSIRKAINKYLKEKETSVINHFIKENFKDGLQKEETERLITIERLEIMTKMMYGSNVTSIACSIDGLFFNNMAYFSDNDNEEENIVRFNLNNNLNIVNQKGVFIFNNNPILSLEEVGMNLYKENNPDKDSYKFSKCINIHKNLKDDIIKYLKKKGITKNYVYPNPKNIAKKVYRLSK